MRERKYSLLQEGREGVNSARAAAWLPARTLKADSKCNGIFPHRFESCSRRHVPSVDGTRKNELTPLLGGDFRSYRDCGREDGRVPSPGRRPGGGRVGGRVSSSGRERPGRSRVGGRISTPGREQPGRDRDVPSVDGTHSHASGGDHAVSAIPKIMKMMMTMS